MKEQTVIDQLNIVHNQAANRFEAAIPPPQGNQFAVVEYRQQGDTIYITRTYTPLAYRGQGIAAAITKVALDHARAQGWRIVPVCSYTVEYIANEYPATEAEAQQ